MLQWVALTGYFTPWLYVVGDVLSFSLLALLLHGLLHAIEEAKKNAKDLQKFKIAADNSMDHIVLTDPNGTIFYANESVHKITGFSPLEILGETPRVWGGIMPKEFYQKFWRTIKEEKKPFVGHITNRKKNGQIYTAETHVSPILDEKEGLLGFLAIERDITKEESIDRAKSEFVSLAAHQLRTPLSVIRWYAEMLLNGDAGAPNKKQTQYLKEIYRGDLRMVTLVNMLLNVSRIDLGTFLVDPKPTDIREVMNEVIKDLEKPMEMKKIKLNVMYADNLPIVNLDPVLTSVVFENILSNAIKYMNPGGALTVSIKFQNAMLLTSVSDTGCGIPKHQQNQMFSKFFRADNAKTLVPDGNGLGLYIVKAIVEHSKGRIWFESEEGKGTTFYVEFSKEGMPKKEGRTQLVGKMEQVPV